jgi:uncharacterized membrane protein YfcA
MTPLLWESLIIFLAGLIQGITGFGFALIAVPLLAFFIPLKTVVPLVVILSLVTNLFIFWETRKQVRLGEIRIITIFGLVGIPFGIVALQLLDSNLLKATVGMLITLTALAMFFGFKVKLRHRTLSSGMAGFLSGFFNSSISMSGPPIVLFLANEDSSKGEFRANLTAYAVITNIVTIGSFLFSRVIDPDVFGHSFPMLPGLLAGMGLGMVAARRINERIFRSIVLGLLVITGIVTVSATLRA